MNGESGKSKPLLALLLLGFILVIGAGGYGFFAKQKSLFESAAQAQLNAIADLKVAQLVRWREERIDDGNLIVGNPLIISAVKHFLTNPEDSSTQNQIVPLLQTLQKFAHYKRVALLDSELRPCLSMPPAGQWISQQDLAWMKAACRTNQIIINDLHIGASNSAVMNLLVPLFDGPQLIPIGCFFMEIDPDDFLFPEIQSWPTPSATAETLLVRREGDDVVYLNELRHQSNTALRLRFSLNASPLLPASRAVKGESGVVAGPDYRHINVLASIRTVPSSPWFIVAKQDMAEIHAPVQEWAWTAISGTTTLIIAASLGIMLLWRNRETQFVRNELSEQQRSEAALEHSYSLLRATSDELERKNSELEILIYAASHDLRSPLVNIEGFSKRLEKSCRELITSLEGIAELDVARRNVLEMAQSQIPKSLNYIRAGVAKMNALISGLLHLSRLGQAALQPRALDMNRMMRQLTTAMAYQIQKTGALVKYNALPPCQGDPLMINQVFSNLLDNAIKYHDPVRPLVIQISGSSERGQTVYCVADTGIGIAKEHQPKIWEIFHRLNPSGSEGEGIGLNLTRRILDRHHGRIWVESTAGEGSRFFVSLPETPPEPVLVAHPQDQPNNTQKKCPPTNTIA